MLQQIAYVQLVNRVRVGTEGSEGGRADAGGRGRAGGQLAPAC